MFELIYTISVKSETTGKFGSKTIKVDINPDGMIEKFYGAVEDCLRQIAGEKDCKDKKE